MTVAPEDVKACCADAYSSAAARFLLGDCFHPGGVALTARLAHALGVGPGAVVVDVASGLGTSAIQVARDTGAAVIGVDLSAENVQAATEAAAAAGLGQRVRFVRGDAETLPLEDASVDGALCECALCTFPDKPAAARELARVVRPGSLVAIADVTARASELPAELTSLDAWVACVADARPLAELTTLLEEGGLELEEIESHDQALAELLERVDVRLRLAKLGAATLFGDRIERAAGLVAAARAALADGVLGYAVLIARRP